VPLRLHYQPEDIAGTVAWLLPATPAASPAGDRTTTSGALLDLMPYARTANAAAQIPAASTTYPGRSSRLRRTSAAPDEPADRPRRAHEPKAMPCAGRRSRRRSAIIVERRRLNNTPTTASETTISGRRTSGLVPTSACARVVTPTTSRTRTGRSPHDGDHPTASATKFSSTAAPMSPHHTMPAAPQPAGRTPQRAEHGRSPKTSDASAISPTPRRKRNPAERGRSRQRRDARPAPPRRTWPH